MEFGSAGGAGGNELTVQLAPGSGERCVGGEQSPVERDGGNGYRRRASEIPDHVARGDSVQIDGAAGKRRGTVGAGDIDHYGGTRRRRDVDRRARVVCVRQIEDVECGIGPRERVRTVVLRDRAIRGLGCEERREAVEIRLRRREVDGISVRAGQLRMIERDAGRVIAVVIDSAPDGTAAGWVDEVAVDVNVMRQRRVVPDHIAADERAAAPQAAIGVREVAGDDEVIDSRPVAGMSGRDAETTVIRRSEVAADCDCPSGIGIRLREIA